MAPPSPRSLSAPALLVLLLLPPALSSECSPPSEPENGGYRCRPSPCRGLPHNTVIEYFCDEGFILKGGEFRTCQDGEWDHSLQISCRPVPDREPGSSLGVPALTAVASTASCVALILLLVVLFVLVQPRLKSFHHSRREQGVSGQPYSIMVGGVQVSLPSYEEAIHGTGSCSPAETPVPAWREGPRRAVGGQVCGSDPQPGDTDDTLTSTSSCRGQTETVLLHRAPSSSSAGPPQGASAGSLSPRRSSGDSDQQSLLFAKSAEEFSDDVPLLKDA